MVWPHHVEVDGLALLAHEQHCVRHDLRELQRHLGVELGHERGLSDRVEQLAVLPDAGLGDLERLEERDCMVLREVESLGNDAGVQALHRHIEREALTRTPGDAAEHAPLRCSAPRTSAGHP